MSEPQGLSAKPIVVCVVFAAAGAVAWYLWSDREPVAPAVTAPRVESPPVAPAAAEAVLAESAAAAPGADAAETKELPQPVVVQEPSGPPPRELSRDEPRDTKWGTLSLRTPPEGSRPAR